MNRAVRHFVRHRTCRLSQSNLPDRTKYTFDANDRLLTERLDTTGNGIAEQLTTYGYTGTQQTSKAVYTGDQPTLGNETSQVTFAYDLQGRMETVVTETWSGGTLTRREQVTYDYDAQGIRVSAGHKTDTDGNGTDLTPTTLSGKGRGHPRLDSTGSIVR